MDEEVCSYLWFVERERGGQLCVFCGGCFWHLVKKGTKAEFCLSVENKSDGIFVCLCQGMFGLKQVSPNIKPSAPILDTLFDSPSILCHDKQTQYQRKKSCSQIHYRQTPLLFLYNNFFEKHICKQRKERIIILRVVIEKSGGVVIRGLVGCQTKLRERKRQEMKRQVCSRREREREKGLFFSQIPFFSESQNSQGTQNSNDKNYPHALSTTYPSRNQTPFINPPPPLPFSSSSSSSKFYLTKPLPLSILFSNSIFIWKPLTEFQGLMILLGNYCFFFQLIGNPSKEYSVF